MYVGSDNDREEQSIERQGTNPIKTKKNREINQ
jgi:hypothetical protein